MQRRRPMHEEWVGGLLDRWIGVAITFGLVPVQNLPDCLPWTAPEWDVPKLVTHHRINIVHGFKRAADFKHLWPQ
jgi:hypothetical protein